MKLTTPILKLTGNFLKLTEKKPMVARNPFKKSISTVNEAGRRLEIIDVWVFVWNVWRKSGLKWTKWGTTRPATQVCPRGVESGLGGHDAGVSGVDERVKDRPFPIWKRSRLVESERPTFSDFLMSEMKLVGEEWNGLRGSIVSLITECDVMNVQCFDGDVIDKHLSLLSKNQRSRIRYWWCFLVEMWRLQI